MFTFNALPPLSLYIHIPWCVKKCPYCDFNSHEGSIPERAYIDALIADLSQDLPRTWGRQVQSIFIGGGTPSLFSPEALDYLLSNVRAMLALQPMAEITLEANPGTVETGRFEEYRALGINRLSIGIQSFNDDLLQRLGRIHTGKNAQHAVELAHKAGFNKINLDLMFALPGQTRSQAESDINTAIVLEPNHISHYQLTVEPNTLFYAQPPTLPDDDSMWAMQEQCQDSLAQAGYSQYEISAYAKEGDQCWHNLNYWNFGDYLGIGAGAHAKITDGAQQNITRLWKQKHPSTYMQDAGKNASISGEQILKPADAGFEFMLNALRLKTGFAPHLFNDHTGLALTQIQHSLEQAEQKGLLHWDVKNIRPTELGQRFLNDLLALFCDDK